MGTNPLRVGVIDLGSNSVLLLIAEHTESGWQVLTDTTTITRLGEGFEPHHRLQSPAIERTLRAVEQYLQTCQQMGVGQVQIVATAVVREATNPQALLKPLTQLVAVYYPLSDSCTIRVLSAQEEAELSFLSVARDPHLPPERPIAVIDIGGGSVEVAFGYETKFFSLGSCRGYSLDQQRKKFRQMEQVLSFPVGAQRVRARWMHSNPPQPKEILHACEQLDAVFAPLQELPIPALTVTIGGTGVNLAMLALRLERFEPAQVHLAPLTSDQIGSLVHFLAQMSDEERALLPNIEPERAPLLPAGALILERALYALRQEQVLVSTYGVRYGVLLSPPRQT